MDLTIFGATGKLGKAIGSLVLKDRAFRLVSAVTRKDSVHLKKEYLSFAKPLLIESTPKKADVLIDVSHETLLEENLKWALLWKKPYVLGVTGLCSSHFEKLKEASQQIPIFYSANFSLQMALFHKIASFILQTSKEDFRLKIRETHHTQKKDAPSGTALSLLKTLKKEGVNISPLDIESIRKDNVVGEHALFFDFEDERITLSHEAFNREIFAKGALRAAQFIENLPPSFYGMEDLLSFSA